MDGISSYPGVARQRQDGAAVAGILFTALLHGGLVAAVWANQQLRSAPPPSSQQYVVAKLVRLGKKRDKKKLPDKVIPQPPTEKMKTVSYDAEATDAPRPKKKKDKVQLADRLRRSFDRAAVLDQAQREIEAEGDPGGVEGGTATEASEGDAYYTRLFDLWRRNWSLPSIIPADEAKKLYAHVVIRIDSQGNIKFPIQFDRSSGNAHFDGSIRTAYAQIKRLPLPPPSRRGSIMAHGIALRHGYKGLQ